MSDGDTAQADPVIETGEPPRIASIETDRFCDGCGYNLRTQAVHRDPRTGILLCRCPECGRFHAAGDQATVGRVWLQRLGVLLLVGWMLMVLGAGFGLAVAQVALCFGTLDELTTYDHTLPYIVASGGQIVITPTSTPTVPWQRRVRENYEWQWPFLALMNGLSGLAGFGITFLAAVTLVHWRRWWYLVPLVVVSAGAISIAWTAWSFEAPNLEPWGRPYLLSQTAMHLAAGLAGVLWGRPVARLIIRIVLPPRLRSVFAFLWLADGKPVPAAGG